VGLFVPFDFKKNYYIISYFIVILALKLKKKVLFHKSTNQNWR